MIEAKFQEQNDKLVAVTSDFIMTVQEQTKKLATPAPAPATASVSKAEYDSLMLEKQKLERRHEKTKRSVKKILEKEAESVVSTRKKRVKTVFKPTEQQS